MSMHNLAGLMRLGIDNGTGNQSFVQIELNENQYKTIMANAYADYQGTHIASGDPRPFNDEIAWYYCCRDFKAALLTP